MNGRDDHGQTNLTTILAVVGLIVAGVWGWKRLSSDAQDYVVEHVMPIAVVTMLAVGSIWAVISKVRQRRHQRRRRERLITLFERESSPERRRDLAFLLIELNDYRVQGLERITPALVEVLITTLKTAVGDKQHRLRGMAASHLGVLQDKQAIPVLLKALEDDHAYVRAGAALGLGRMRAAEAKEKLADVMKEDWDQTVRSRAREALERIV
jgi:hypothetical protein